MKNEKITNKTCVTNVNATIKPGFSEIGLGLVWGSLGATPQKSKKKK